MVLCTEGLGRKESYGAERDMGSKTARYPVLQRESAPPGTTGEGARVEVVCVARPVAP